MVEDRYSKEETKSIQTGIMALFVILIGVFATVSHNASIKQKNIRDTYKIYANFGRTDGLEIGSAVRVAGINVGRVVAAELDEHFNSKLTFEIDSRYKLPEDSSASIVSFGLIGGKYVEIEVGGEEEYLTSGSTISYTQDAMILEELLDRIISIGRSNRAKAKAEKETENIESESLEELNKGDEDE